MVVKSIDFPTYFEDITDIENDFIDVFVELENGYIYTVTVATAKALESIMDEEKLSYFRPGPPFIIVKELKKEIIKEALKAYGKKTDSYREYNVGYWLKIYHFANRIKKTVFDTLQAEEEYEKLQKLDFLV